MVVTESTETAFGTQIKGVTIQMTLEEAQKLIIILGHGVANPPTDRHGNYEYGAQAVGSQVCGELRKIVR